MTLFDIWWDIKTECNRIYKLLREVDEVSNNIEDISRSKYAINLLSILETIIDDLDIESAEGGQK